MNAAREMKRTDESRGMKRREGPTRRRRKQVKRTQKTKKGAEGWKRNVKRKMST